MGIKPEPEPEPIPTPIRHRHDQMAYDLYQEAKEALLASIEYYDEGRYEQAYTELQCTLASIAELFKGFGLQPEHEMVSKDFSGLAPTD